MLLPPRCVGCGRRGAEVCSICRERLRPLGPALCPRCSVPAPGGRVCRQCAGRPHAVQAILAHYPFEGAVRAAVVALKYRSRTRVAPFLASILEAALASRPLSVDLLVPVPLSRSRLRSRGFNQSETLARHLGSLRALPVESSVLVRQRDTRAQTELPARERRRNVAGAFTVLNPEGVAERHILLVDDVCTTGATLEACGQALLDAGAARVWAVVAARELTKG